MKSKSWMAFCALLLTSGLVACTTSITESATDVCADLENRESFDAFESTATNLFCDGEFHGGVLIADGADDLYQDAFGAADLIGTPNSSDARYHIFSITKPFTAILTLQLVQDGKLALSDTLSAHLPELNIPNADIITIHHLLAHQSGVPDYLFAIPGYMSDSPPNLSRDEIVERVQQSDPDFQPGEAYLYSNTGYVLLSMILETVTEEAYADLLKARIFEPLGMDASAWTDLPVNAIEMSLISNDGMSIVAAERMQTGEAGIVSTLPDMHRFAMAIGTDTLMNAEMWELAFTPHSDPSNAFRPHPVTFTPYGYGFTLIEASDSENRAIRIAMHGGLGQGGSASMERGIEDDWIVLYWNNRGGIPPITSSFREAAIQAN